jgi:hypothetical protein
MPEAFAGRVFPVRDIHRAAIEPLPCTVFGELYE